MGVPVMGERISFCALASNCGKGLEDRGGCGRPVA